MATTKTKETRRPCVDGTQAHKRVILPADGGMYAGACSKCGDERTYDGMPPSLRKQMEYRG